jgi:Cytoskeletal-regulatory complex EF hand
MTLYLLSQTRRKTLSWPYLIDTTHMEGPYLVSRSSPLCFLVPLFLNWRLTASPGAQGIQILSRSQLPTNVLAQIWDLADADRSGSLSRGEFVIAMYLVKLLMDRRRANPGREDEQMPSEVPPWLRAEAARMDGAGNRMTPMSTGVVGGPIGPGGFRIPGSTPMSTPYRPPDRPPSPSLLDLDNEALPSQPPSLGINDSSTRLSPNPSLQDYLNRPVPPTPPQRTSEDAPPPYVELDNTLPLHSRVPSVS